MTEINPIAAALPSRTGGSDTAGAAANLTENFETFLTLLTEQLENQDPLNPLESQEFVAQLVQFSAVEQQIASNESLEGLLALQAATAQSSAVAYTGRTVEVSSPRAVLSEGQARWSYDLERPAAETRLLIRDASGEIVARLDGETVQGLNTLTWDGRADSGAEAPDGAYTLEVLALDADGEPVEARIRITGRVEGVDLAGDAPEVTIGGLSYPAANVVAVREAS